MTWAHSSTVEWEECLYMGIGHSSSPLGPQICSYLFYMFSINNLILGVPNVDPYPYTYVRTNVRTDGRTYGHTYIRTYVRTYITFTFTVRVTVQYSTLHTYIMYIVHVLPCVFLQRGTRSICFYARSWALCRPRRWYLFYGLEVHERSWG